jgi:hypothetical protein
MREIWNSPKGQVKAGRKPSGILKAETVSELVNSFDATQTDPDNSRFIGMRQSGGRKMQRENQQWHDQSSIRYRKGNQAASSPKGQNLISEKR